MSAQALIFHGGWEGHQPRATAEILARLLTAGGYAVTVVDHQEVLLDAAGLCRFDLIVPHWTMGTLPKGAAANLSAAVAAGTGLAGVHGGMGDAFRSETDFQFMTGGQFVSHPGGIKPYRVRMKERAHPITAGLEDFDVNTEQYYMHVDPANEVLVETTFDGVGAAWTEGVVMPVAWTRRHGAGKVFYCSLGHTPSDLEVPTALELIRRGLLWAARPAS